MRGAEWLDHLLLVLFASLARCGDVKPKKETYLPDYAVYHNLSTIQTHIGELAASHPGLIKLDPMYKSRNNRSQFLLRITNFTDSRSSTASNQMVNQKVKMLLSYGEHAREFLPIESMFHLLHNLTEGLKSPKGSPPEIYSRTVLSKIDLFIVAIVNPDGRKYVEDTKNYCWRGTRNGVDLNRNFDWRFGQKGSSADKNDEEFRGSYAFSEPECLVLTELTAKYHFDAFVSFHSGIRQIYVPFADTVSKEQRKQPENILNMMDLAHKMAEATSHTFSYGVAYQVNDYTADGTVFDYMAGVRKIPFSFAIELWGIGDHPGAKCFDLFNPQSQDLQRAVTEVHPIYFTLFKYLISWKEEELEYMSDATRDAPSLTLGYVLLLLCILLTLFVSIHSRLPPCLRLYPRRRVISIRSLSSTFSIMNFS